MKFWACLLTLLMLLPSVSEAGKKSKRKGKQQEQVQQPAPAPAAPAVDPWETYQSALTLKANGQLDEALQKLLEVSTVDTSPIEWCYSRLHLADVYFQLGNQSEGAVRAEKYKAARERFAEAVICVRKPSSERTGSDGTDWEAEAMARLSEAERAAVEEFRSWEPDELAKELTATSKKQAQVLYEAGNHEDLVAHWRYHVALYGASRQAYFNIGMTCLELGDLDGARQSVLEAQELPEEFSSDLPDPVGAAVERALALASAVEPGSLERDRYYRFIFGLLSEWHEREPLAREPKDLLEEALIPVEREERVRLLALAEDCWVPIHIFQYLQEEDREFIDEARIAIDCNPDDPVARSALAHTYYAEAKQAWGSIKTLTADEFSQVGKVNQHIRRARSVLTQLDQALEIEPGFSTANNMKASVLSYLEQLEAQTADLRKDQQAETMIYCNQRWSRLTWWSDRRFELLAKTPSIQEMDGFERECTEFIRKKDLDVGVESIREEVVESRLLLKCRKKLKAIEASGSSADMEQFEKDCALYVEYFANKDEAAKR